MYKKIVFCLAILAVAAVASAVAEAQSNTTTTLAVPANRPLVTAQQLKTVGFTEPMVQGPSKDRFPAPVYYFKVKESIQDAAQAKTWGDNANIVSITIVPKTDTAWIYNGAQVEIHDMSGRVQARASGANNYVVVTGPDLTKVVNLAHTLEVLY